MGWMSVRSRHAVTSRESSETTASIVLSAPRSSSTTSASRPGAAPPAAQASMASLGGSSRVIVTKRVRSLSEANSSWPRTKRYDRHLLRRKRIERVDPWSVLVHLIHAFVVSSRRSPSPHEPLHHTPLNAPNPPSTARATTPTRTRRGARTTTGAGRLSPPTSPKRASGVCATISRPRGVSSPPSSKSSRRFCSPTKKPGAMALTRSVPCGRAGSTASQRVRSRPRPWRRRSRRRASARPAAIERC